MTTTPTPAPDAAEIEALLPCPFCGGAARLSRHPKGYDLAHCADGTCDPGHLTFAVPEKWNRRSLSRPVGVTDAMVERGMEEERLHPGWDHEVMRAILTAALGSRDNG